MGFSRRSEAARVLERVYCSEVQIARRDTLLLRFDEFEDILEHIQVAHYDISKQWAQARPSAHLVGSDSLDWHED